MENIVKEFLEMHKNTGVDLVDISKKMETDEKGNLIDSDLLFVCTVEQVKETTGGFKSVTDINYNEDISTKFGNYQYGDIVINNKYSLFAY